MLSSQIAVAVQAVTIKDVADFFVDHAVSDNLGIIANAHLAMADASEDVRTEQHLPEMEEEGPADYHEICHCLSILVVYSVIFSAAT